MFKFVKYKIAEDICVCVCIIHLCIASHERTGISEPQSVASVQGTLFALNTASFVKAIIIIIIIINTS